MNVPAFIRTSNGCVIVFLAWQKIAGHALCFKISFSLSSLKVLVSLLAGNKAKILRKTNISYPLIRVCIKGKKLSLCGKFSVLCFLETPVLRFALLPYYWRLVLSPGNVGHFAFSRVFFSSQGESKTPATSETELFVTFVNKWKLLAHVTWCFIQDITEVLYTFLS